MRVMLLENSMADHKTNLSMSAAPKGYAKWLFLSARHHLLEQAHEVFPKAY
jgi:superfamily II DNA or RNA helicase